MGFFTQLADAAFKTSPNGDRLFYAYGPWVRPYILPDMETEQRLRQKLGWYYCIVVPFVLAITVGFQYFHPGTFSSNYFQIFTLVILVIVILSLRLTLKSELRDLNRAPSRAWGSFLENVAEKRSYLSLGLQLLACLAFVGCGLALFLISRMTLSLWIATGFFGLIAVAVFYVMLLKRAKST